MEGPVLIFTAGFGEGHNSAAFSLESAINERHEAIVDDAYHESFPRINNQARKIYRRVTTYSPKIWSRYYKSTDRQDYTRKRIPLLRRAERRVHRLIAEHKPSALVSTYPIYPYYFDRYTSTNKPKVYTVITDSLVINKSWLKAPTDCFLVTDELTKANCVKQGIAESRIQVTGFPVSPKFSQLTPMPANEEVAEFKVLYFPIPRKPHVRRTLRALMDNPNVKVKVTVVLGRSYKHLIRKTRQIQAEFPDQIDILGWVDNVPELLNQHHLVLGKAGGATVHEAIAAACPMLIHHIVPGQEEGNLQLLRHIGGGELCDSEQKVRQMMHALTANQGQEWRKMKQRLLEVRRPDSARQIASFMLDV